MAPGNFIDQVDSVFLATLILSTIFLVGLTATMVYFVYRYHESRNKTPEDIHGDIRLEIMWTAIPTVLVMGMFYFGMTGFTKMETVPDDAMSVKTTGRMWSWSYEYENGGVTDKLYVPVGKPVVLELEATDVIHSYYIPAFRIKKDAVPAVDTRMWFQADRAGTYDVFCAEYCGDRHSYMLSEVIALPPAEFDEMYPKLVSGEPVLTGDPETDAVAIAGWGKKIAQANGCFSCHTQDGTAMVGPSFKELYGRLETVLVDGQEQIVDVDADYLIRSVTDPDAEIVKGYNAGVMPKHDLSDAELNALVEFIKSLR